MPPINTAWKSLPDNFLPFQQPQNNTSEQCPNVNPFPLASLLQPTTNGGHVSSTQTSTTGSEPGSENQKQLLQQRLIDRIKVCFCLFLFDCLFVCQSVSWAFRCDLDGT